LKICSKYDILLLVIGQFVYGTPRSMSYMEEVIKMPQFLLCLLVNMISHCVAKVIDWIVERMKKGLPRQD